jgi:eukaryotic-like serine/threonine-protein kinase
MSLSPGTKLGPYEIQAPLGAGGMGEVYRARDTRLDRIVAIKVLLSRLSSDPDLKQRLGREARAISSLNHPHICALYDIGTQEDIDFLVMEYLEGQTLADRLQKGALPIEQVLKTGIEIADALAKAHRQGIIHRDLKTGNIMLTKSGAKLMDFGLAKPVRAAFLAGTSVGTPTLSNRLTTEGTIVGTLQYMAPEQLEGKEADVRSDIFAFGAVLYEMVTGKSAFGGKTPASIVAAILASAPTPVATLQPTSPTELNRLIATALAKNPDDRWESASDIRIGLAGISPTGEHCSSRSHKLLLWQAAVALLIAATLTLRNRDICYLDETES